MFRVFILRLRLKRWRRISSHVTTEPTCLSIWPRRTCDNIHTYGWIGGFSPAIPLISPRLRYSLDPRATKNLNRSTTNHALCLWMLPWSGLSSGTCQVMESSPSQSHGAQGPACTTMSVRY
ncbi:hypothetical protein BJX96DRAFT_57850 [Aspergillus floccosus]